MDLTLSINPVQKQILSQKMIQSVNILQMDSLELNQYLTEITQENPLLELIPHKSEEYPFNDPEDESQDWKFHEETAESLQEHLWNQIVMFPFPAKDEPALHFLLDSLDNNGYYTDSLNAFAYRFNLTKEHAAKMLIAIRSLSPAGVGARNLEDCLCLQLERQGCLSPQLEDFIKNHLRKMAKNQLPAIAHSMNLPLTTIEKYCHLVRQLNPKPGSIFTDSRLIPYIIPDVLIVKTAKHFEIMLNECLYPDVCFNTEYVKMSHEQTDPEIHAYIADKLRQAEWIRQCMEQRNTTLFRVAQAILSEQDTFFQNGPAFLKPLGMSKVADTLGIHESTVSRAASGKYLQCYWGVFPLTSFFVKAAPDRQSGFTVSDVKAALKNLISHENEHSPYSDQMLSELLTVQGFTISRRTVAKYRYEECIPPRSGRKSFSDV